MGRFPKVRENIINEDGIYKPLSVKPNHYDVVVSMRIGKRQLQRKKKDIKNIGPARLIRDKLIRDLEKIKAENDRGDIFWDQALTQYFQHLMVLVKSKEMSLATYENRKSALTAHTETWKSKRVSEIHQEWIRIFFSEHFTDQQLETKKSVLKYIRQVFKYQIASGNKTLMFNPTTGFKLKKESKTNPPTFSKDEMEKIIRHAHEVGSEWAPIYYLAYQTGARSGELFALRWENIDWDRETLAIKQSYCWKMRDYKIPKNNEERILVLNSQTIRYLKELKLKSKTEFILPHLPAWKKGRAAQLLKSVKDTLGIVGKTNFHSIRSTFITELLMANVPPIKVMELAGHKDFKTTIIYVRSVGKHLKGTTDTLGFEIAPSNVHQLKKEA